MNTVVLYTSKTGFTQQYAQQIAQALHCEARPAKGMTAEQLAPFDRVVYGGWVFGGLISGLAKVRPLIRGELTVFAVGASAASDSVLQAIRERNALGDSPLYYLEGGMRMDKQGFFMRLMLGMVSKAAAKKENPTEQERMMGTQMGTSFDHTDPHAIEPLLASLQG